MTISLTSPFKPKVFLSFFFQIMLTDSVIKHRNDQKHSFTFIHVKVIPLQEQFLHLTAAKINFNKPLAPQQSLYLLYTAHSPLLIVSCLLNYLLLAASILHFCTPNTPDSNYCIQSNVDCTKCLVLLFCCSYVFLPLFSFSIFFFIYICVVVCCFCLLQMQIN